MTLRTRWVLLGAVAILISLLIIGGSYHRNQQARFWGYDAYFHHGASSLDAQYVRFRRADGYEEYEIEIPRQMPRLVLEYQATVSSGRVVLKILDPDGKAILGGYTDADGHLKLYHSLIVQPGTYTVRMQYENARKGEIRYTIYSYYR